MCQNRAYSEKGKLAVFSLLQLGELQHDFNDERGNYTFKQYFKFP